METSARTEVLLGKGNRLTAAEFPALRLHLRREPVAAKVLNTQQPI
jgi:hypothetical protein